MFVGGAVFRKGWSEGLGGPIQLPLTARLGGAGGGDLVPDGAHFSVGGGLQPLDLFFERADGRHLADVGRHAPEKQIAGDVERSRRNVALIGVRFHFFRARQLSAQIGERSVMYFPVGGDKRLAGGFIGSGIGGRKFRRRDESGLAEVLIARRFRLTVPKLLVFHFGGGEFGNTLKTHDDVAQVGDGRVAVLEVKTLQELRRIMGAHPGQGFDDGIRRPAVSRQRVSALLRRHRSDG